MIKPKNHWFSKMFDMQTILVLDQKLIKVLVFFLFDINFVDSSKFRISRIRQFVHNSLTNKFCCHVSYLVTHKLKQLTKTQNKCSTKNHFTTHEICFAACVCR